MNKQLSMLDDPPPMPILAGYDWIVISSSAGKDSQATLDYVYEQAEREGVTSRLVVVHCDLGRVEWRGTRELAESQAAAYGLRCIVVWRKQGDLLAEIEGRGMFPGPATRFCTAHHKTGQVSRVLTQLAAEARETESRGTEAREGDLLQHVEERGMWPSPRQRYCTSDHKRAQVHRVYTQIVDETRQAGTWQIRARRAARAGQPIPPVRILSCMGMRAQESPARAKRQPLTRNTAASNGRRIVDDWLPLHRWSEEEVWTRIAAGRQKDLVHHAYGLGMPRLSCCFCIFAPKSALVLAGKHNPELLAEYVRVEEKIGHKFRQELSMADVQKAVQAGEGGKVATWAM